MRKLLSTAFMLVLVVPVLGQTVPPAPAPAAPTKKVSEYKKQLEDLQMWGKNLTNDKFYEERFKFRDKKTGKEQKFADFPEFDRRMFQMTTSQRFNRHLDKTEATWQDELKKVTGKVPDSKADPDAIAGADDLANFIKDMVKLRKEAVLTWEKQANGVFKDFPKEFEENDRKLYLKNIQTLKDSLEKR